MANLEAIGRSQPFVKVQSPPNVAQRAPTTTDTNYPKGATWLDESVSPSQFYTHLGGGDWDAGANSYATTTTPGIVELSTDAEAQAKTSTTNVLTASNLAAEGFLQYADVTLDSDQVKALATTQITLVAAQGAGTTILFMGAVLKLDYGGTNAFAEDADNLTIKYTDDSGAAVSQAIEMTGFIDQTADTYTNALPVINSIAAATAAENQPLVLDNINDNITGNAGDDNALVVRTYYLVQSI